MNHIREIIFLPEYAFLRQAFWVSALASLSFGIIGTFVVVRRIGYLAGAISHCAFGGIGIGIFLQQTLIAAGLTTLASQLNPITTAVVFSVLSAFLIGAVQSYAKEREDAVIGAVWAVGMAVGILFLDNTNGYHNVSAYLFGEILLISNPGVRAVALLGLAVLLIVGVLFKRFEAVCFDEENMTLHGLSPRFYFQILLILVAVTVVLMIQLVGVILVIALLTLPAATAARLTNRLLSMTIVSSLLCFLYSWLGLYLSSLFNLAAAPVIIIIAVLGYTAIVLNEFLFRKYRM
ncbi:membrane protein [Campylobacterota bacterium]|nr:membrane protein [Campylobacterota bacterium]